LVVLKVFFARAAASRGVAGDTQIHNSAMHKRRDFKQGDPACEAMEAQWMAQMAAGGPPADEALAALFVAYGPLFVARLRFYGLDIDEAQDVAQDLWMEVARAAPRYRAEAPVRSFLLGFLKTAKTRYFSERGKLPPLASTSDEAVAATMELALHALSASTADEWDRFDFVRCVRRAFAALEQDHPRLARLLVLRHVEELSLEEIVELLGGRPEAAKAEVFSARNKFRPKVAHCLSLWPNQQRGDDERS
jgi:RNA polymerase sigma factor (sigma-70 family)